jgi:hypothetical protein
MASVDGAKLARGAAMTPNPRKQPHAPFLDEDAATALEHGERVPTPHADELVGTSGSHTAEADERAEEPYGELADSSTAEGGDD